MASLRTQNALLFVIALCLVLLVAHLYSGHLVDKAQAAAPERPFPNLADLSPGSPAPAGATAVILYGCYHDKVFEPCQWKALQVDPNGFLRR